MSVVFQTVTEVDFPVTYLVALVPTHDRTVYLALQPPSPEVPLSTTYSSHETAGSNFRPPNYQNRKMKNRLLNRKNRKNKFRLLNYPHQSSASPKIPFVYSNSFRETHQPLQRHPAPEDLRNFARTGTPILLLTR